MENINMINLSPYLAGPGVYIARNMLDVNPHDLSLPFSLRLNPKKIQFGVKLYPNPAKESVSLEYYLSEGSANLRIMDLMGRLVANYSINSEENIFTFNVKNLIEGVYFIQIDQNDRNLYTNKFIVIKK